jgi:hypothetical protein
LHSTALHRTPPEKNENYFFSRRCSGGEEIIPGVYKLGVKGVGIQCEMTQTDPINMLNST